MRFLICAVAAILAMAVRRQVDSYTARRRYAGRHWVRPCDSALDQRWAAALAAMAARRREAGWI